MRLMTSMTVCCMSVPRLNSRPNGTLVNGRKITRHELSGVDHLVMRGFSNGDLFASSNEGLVIRLVPNS